MRAATRYASVRHSERRSARAGEIGLAAGAKFTSTMSCALASRRALACLVGVACAAARVARADCSRANMLRSVSALAASASSAALSVRARAASLRAPALAAVASMVSARLAATRASRSRTARPTSAALAARSEAARFATERTRSLWAFTGVSIASSLSVRAAMWASSFSTTSWTARSHASWARAAAPISLQRWYLAALVLAIWARSSARLAAALISIAAFDSARSERAACILPRASRAAWRRKRTRSNFSICCLRDWSRFSSAEAMREASARMALASFSERLKRARSTRFEPSASAFSRRCRSASRWSSSAAHARAPILVGEGVRDASGEEMRLGGLDLGGSTMITRLFVTQGVSMSEAIARCVAGRAAVVTDDD
mmetsp:Transcript_86/g.222  ORF Transcript_86/g.222 Transcript_86/m.222 type:complete len:375 (-) Transcript_86:28-1152(-)